MNDEDYSKRKNGRCQAAEFGRPNSPNQLVSPNQPGIIYCLSTKILENPLIIQPRWSK
jgi:hypothetical protein